MCIICKSFCIGYNGLIFTDTEWKSKNKKQTKINKQNTRVIIKTKFLKIKHKKFFEQIHIGKRIGCL